MDNQVIEKDEIKPLWRYVSKLKKKKKKKKNSWWRKQYHQVQFM